MLPCHFQKSSENCQGGGDIGAVLYNSPQSLYPSLYIGSLLTGWFGNCLFVF